MRHPTLLRKWKKRIYTRSALLVSRVRRDAIVAGWCGYNNFGDRLTPYILREFGLTPIYVEPHRAEFVGVGSIMDYIPPHFRGTIFGSGFLYPPGAAGMGRGHSHSFDEANVLAVRGRYTASRIAAGTAVAMGDPGLLTERVFHHVHSSVSKRYCLGVVPHYSEKNSVAELLLPTTHSDHVKIIDVQRTPGQVIADIAACEFIASSSLHGLVVADSLRIPNVWVTSTRLLGGEYKFHDYYSAFGIERRPASLDQRDANSLIEQCSSVHGDTLAMITSRLEHKLNSFVEAYLER